MQQVARAPCVTALILPECTGSSCKAARTALSQTAQNSVISSPPPSGKGGHLIENVTSYWRSTYYIAH